MPENKAQSPLVICICAFGAGGGPWARVSEEMGCLRR
jgi:hypothetical protein